MVNACKQLVVFRSWISEEGLADNGEGTGFPSAH